MPLVYEPSRLASNGKAGRIYGDLGIDVYLDVITSINRSSEFRRTTTALEQGAALTVHRKRVPQTVTLSIVASDSQPFLGALLIGLWEPDHAQKTLDRLESAQKSPTELSIWTGTGFLRTPAGSQVWVLDNIDYVLEGAEEGVLRATLTFGESPRFSTLFTTVQANVSDEIADVVGNSAERGRQSTSAVGAEPASEIAAGVF